MGMNVQKGNMYDFVTHTWNTVKGKCPHGCTYCYMHRFPQNEVRFDSNELKTDLGSGNFIFVGSSCDMFAENIPHEWIQKTMAHCAKHDNSYLFQTKNPNMFERMYPHGFPSVSKLCTTIETNRHYPEMGNAPSTKERAEAMHRLNDWNYRFETMVTIEPIMDFDLKEMVEIIKRCEPWKVNIGSDSGGNHLPEPSADKVLALIEELKKFTTIAKKRNIVRLLEKEGKK